MTTSTVLVVAKAPVPGKAKTRLAPALGEGGAAELAAASLLDTLEAALSTSDTRVVVAFTGALSEAHRRDDIADALRACEVIPQRGNDFAHRLCAAHADVATLYPGSAVLQIGMDTPQITAELLADSLATTRKFGGALGRATDGGWWALGLTDPLDAAALADVSMSTEHTGADTEQALRRRGVDVAPLPVLSDVDTIADAHEVAALIPNSRFANAFAVSAP